MILYKSFIANFITRHLKNFQCLIGTQNLNQANLTQSVQLYKSDDNSDSN